MYFIAEKDAQATKIAPKTKPEPSAAGPVWRGGARERADDVFFATGIKRRRSKADFAPTWRRRGDLKATPQLAVFEKILGLALSSIFSTTAPTPARFIAPGALAARYPAYPARPFKLCFSTKAKAHPPLGMRFGFV